MGASSWEQFSAPLLNARQVKDKLALLERLMGRSTSQSTPMAAEIVKDMTVATDYPPHIEGVLLPVQEITAIANVLCNYVTSLQGPGDALE